MNVNERYLIEEFYIPNQSQFNTLIDKVSRRSFKILKRLQELHDNMKMLNERFDAYL